LLEACERVVVAVVATDEPQVLDEPGTSVAIVGVAELGETRADALSQSLEPPALAPDRDDRCVEVLSPNQRLHRRENLAISEIARRAEQHDGIGLLGFLGIRHHFTRSGGNHPNGA
jgi:hypothetical protein